MRSHIPHRGQPNSRRHSSSRRVTPVWANSVNVAGSKRGAKDKRRFSHHDATADRVVDPDLTRFPFAEGKNGYIAHGPKLPRSTPGRCLVLAHNGLLSSELPYYCRGLLTHVEFTRYVSLLNEPIRKHNMDMERAGVCYTVCWPCIFKNRADRTAGRVHQRVRELNKALHKTHPGLTFGHEEHIQFVVIDIDEELQRKGKAFRAGQRKLLHTEQSARTPFDPYASRRRSNGSTGSRRRSNGSGGSQRRVKGEGGTSRRRSNTSDERRRSGASDERRRSGASARSLSRRQSGASMRSQRSRSPVVTQRSPAMYAGTVMIGAPSPRRGSDEGAPPPPALSSRYLAPATSNGGFVVDGGGDSSSDGETNDAIPRRPAGGPVVHKPLASIAQSPQGGAGSPITAGPSVSPSANDLLGALHSRYD